VNWTPACSFDELIPERGVCALVEGRQVALFRLMDGSLAAVSNWDPYADAGVISRGIVGSRGAIPTVASPLHKQVYDLRTGVCLDDPELRLDVFEVRVASGEVQLAPAAARARSAA
jgi:nitrite reductase (NADH) small subunit